MGEDMGRYAMPLSPKTANCSSPFLAAKAMKRQGHDRSENGLVSWQFLFE